MMLRSALLVTVMGAGVMLAGCDGMPGSEPDLNALAEQWNTPAKQWSEADLLRLDRGQKFYKRTCAACHMGSGEGQVSVGAPALKDNAFVSDEVEPLIELVLEGKGTMPGFSHSVTGMELADILTYISNAWGNDSGMTFTMEQVDALR
ncbi:c-type cytochrome [Aliamphritea spongicola]|uniref:c-type cytochrome n=1 Tax=Aliamphritea spongicola TaxID=707589 RepID=UPI00196BA1C1|nr:cytochrome c [Aliamphritea spongicola]MBN3561512.1 cytochrome c [Aliamphritea spongicola]